MFYLNKTLCKDAHNKQFCRTLLCQLHRTKKKKKKNPLLPVHMMLPINVFLSFSLGSLLAGFPDNKLNKPQRIQNHAAQLVFRKHWHASATQLRTLHWLPVKARIQYLLLSVFSLSIRTVCHHIFLTFFSHTIPL